MPKGKRVFFRLSENSGTVRGGKRRSRPAPRIHIESKLPDLAGGKTFKVPDSSEGFQPYPRNNFLDGN